jgi:hypothetical protein
MTSPVKERGVHRSRCSVRPSSPSLITLVVKHIPSRCSVVDVIDAIGGSGFQGRFEYMVVPMRRNSSKNKGHAFACFTDPQQARQFFDATDGIYVTDGSSANAVTVEICMSSMPVEQIASLMGDFRVVDTVLGPAMFGSRGL